MHEPIKIFYSWQSWTPSARNREFIEDALKTALALIEEAHDQPLIIDRDTKNLPGAPAIADSILHKIEQCDIFLADVTIVVKNDEHESPNPNVMLELGYAVKCLAWDRIILVMNRSLGSPESLPFDLRHRRWPLAYELKSGDSKNAIREQLIGGLKVAIEAVLHHGLPSVGESITDTVERFIEQGSIVSLDKVVSSQIEQVYQETSSDSFFENRQKLLEDHSSNRDDVWNAGFGLYFRKCEEVLNILLSICWYGHPEQDKYISKAMKRWMEQRANDPSPLSSWRYAPSLFLMYLAGVAAIGNRQWSYLAAALLGNPSPNRHNINIIDHTGDQIAEHLIYYYLNNHRTNHFQITNTIGKTMQETLRPMFVRLIPSEVAFNQAFDIFEFLFALQHLYARLDTNLQKFLLPRYGSYSQYPVRSDDAIMSFLEDGGRKGDNWELLRTGLFAGSSEQLLTVLGAYQERFEKARATQGFGLASSDYFNVYRSCLMK